MRLLRALMVVLATCAFIILPGTQAQAHTPQFGADCDGVRVGATSYDGTKANRWSVTINGATQTGTFGASFSQTFPVPQNGATSTWSAMVEAQDGTFHFEDGGTVGPCGTPPPVDVCVDLPGDQPAGTSCAPPPNVERAEKGNVEGCVVDFGGTSYGAGSLTYDELFTDTYVFNAGTNVWDLVIDTVPTIANLVFTPWSTADQVAAGCLTQPGQPQDLVSKDRSKELDCIDGVVVTKVTTTTIEHVYDDATNSWVPGEPVTTTEKTETPAAPGACDDGEEPDSGVSPTSANNNSPAAAPAVAPAAAPAAPAAPVSVPTAVDAGLSESVLPVASGTERAPWGLLVVALGAVLLAGSLLTRRTTR